MRKSRFSLQAQADGEYELLIYDYIDPWGVTAQGVVAELAALERTASIRVRFNSGGGDLFDGVAIYNALAAHPGKVISQIDGLAASAASLVALAGDEVEIATNAFLMIHHPWTFAIGNAEDLRAEADLLDKLSHGALVSVYVAFTGQSEEQVRTWMAEETWFNADEALEHGFATKVVDLKEEAAVEGGGDAAARVTIDLGDFRNVPDLAVAAWGGDMNVRRARPTAIMAPRIHVESVAPELAATPDPVLPPGPVQDVVAAYARSIRTLQDTADLA